jgi:hypothetical protein
LAACITAGLITSMPLVELQEATSVKRSFCTPATKRASVSRSGWLSVRAQLAPAPCTSAHVSVGPACAGCLASRSSVGPRTGRQACQCRHVVLPPIVHHNLPGRITTHRLDRFLGARSFAPPTTLQPDERGTALVAGSECVRRTLTRGLRGLDDSYG